jgi:hypothetical protein
MSQQGPILVIWNTERPAVAAALGDAGLFPIIDCGWIDAGRAIAEAQPAAVLVAMKDAVDARLDALARLAAARRPHLPLIAIDPESMLPESVLPFSQQGSHADRLIARLRAALRIRSLHATVLRRLADGALQSGLPDTDPAHDATALLIGRGGNYPALSVALGERMGLVGALSIEAAANHLNHRDIDGIVLGEGFTARVVDAFLTVLSEDSRFRHLPVILTSHELAPTHDLPNLEIICGEPALIAANALPLIRQHAFETQLNRGMRALDARGLLDPQTGLLTQAAFDRDFSAAVTQTLANGGGLSVVRFAFDPAHARARLDGARIVSRLMRRMDFGALQQDGSVIAVLTDTDLRAAHGIARRLTSVMRHTSHGPKAARSEPSVTVATLLPTDTASSLRARLYDNARRAAS